MERCFIADMRRRLIGKLSKGYRQRVGLAQALLGDPEVLILDEPTIGLDPKQISEIRALIRSLAGQHTVILSTHILPEVSMVCDGVIIINRGRIVAQGTQTELVEQVFPTARIEVEIGGPRDAVAGGPPQRARRPRGGGSRRARTGPCAPSSSRRVAETCAARWSSSCPRARGASSSCTRWA